jgi:isoleucyl-tRNA synthetase
LVRFIDDLSRWYVRFNKNCYSLTPYTITVTLTLYPLLFDTITVTLQHITVTLTHITVTLTHRYVRFNKNRLKGTGEDCAHALATLFKVLIGICRIMGPFTPFLVEHMYQNLKGGMPAEEQEDSVHYLMVIPL